MNEDFIDDYQAIPDFHKELTHFAVNPFDRNQKLTPELFLDFLIFKNNKYVIEKLVKDLEGKETMVEIIVLKNLNKTITLFENGRQLITFEKNIVLAQEYYLSY